MPTSWEKMDIQGNSSRAATIITTEASSAVIRRRWPCFVQSPRMGRRPLRPNIDNDFAGGGDYGLRRVSRDLMTAL